MYKAFVKLQLDYGDKIYDEAYNETFHQKLESMQYNACLALSEAIRESSREKPCQELGLQSLQRRRWYRKRSSFYKIFKENKPVYPFNLIPTKNRTIVPEIQIKLLYFVLNITFQKFFFSINCH